jgi:hypothetical protein
MKRDDDQPPPLPDFALSLLAAERRRPPPSARQRHSVWRRARGTLIAAGLLAPGLWAGKVSLAAVLWTAVATGAGVGTVTAVKWLGAQHEPPAQVRTLPVRATPDRPTIATPAVLEPAPAPVPSGEAQVQVPVPVRPVARAPRESALIDKARAALARGELEAALQALDGHAVRFPSGLFQEEREALLVLTVARTGRLDAARAQAVGFRRRFPDSVFLRLVDEALTGR